MNIEKLVINTVKTLAVLLLIGVSGVVKAQAPACWPDIQVKQERVVVKNLPSGFRDKRVAIYTCATATGYKNTFMTYNDADIAMWVPKLLAGAFSKTEADAYCKQNCSLIMEDNLVAAITKLRAPYLAYATVSLNNGATSRPVRLINADGTLGDAIASTVARVPVGVPCRLNRRVLGSYFSVEGQPNIATLDPNDTLEKVAAVCTAVLPIGANGAS